MKNKSVVGIVAEFNPFHNGHQYLIRRAKELCDSEIVVCALSGNFVQRGAPAMMDKYSRASIALENGADVVVEIPVIHCLGNASVYASSAISILESMGAVSHLAFGSESGDISYFHELEAQIRVHQTEIEQTIERYSRQGMSYPMARERAYGEVLSVNTEFLRGSNDILAYEYLRNLREIKPIAIPRLGAGYRDEYIEGEQYQSGTGIRSMIRSNGDVSSYVPYNTDSYTALFSDEAWFNLIRYRILTATPEEIENLPGAGEGLGHRIRSVVNEARSLDDLILRTKSKRYTYTRISRTMFQLLLGIDRSLQSRLPEYIRILGFTQRGQALLRDIRKQERNTLPMVTNINKMSFSSTILDAEIRATDIYNLANDRDMLVHAERRQNPIMK